MSDRSKILWGIQEELEKRKPILNDVIDRYL